MKCTGEGNKCTASHSGRPGPSDQTLRLVRRKVEDNPCYNASDIAIAVDISLRTAVSSYRHNLVAMAELQAGNHFFVQLILSRWKIGLVTWLRGAWHFR